jgi:hypothetical protein
MWMASARYADGTEIEQYFPYREDGNYNRECDRQYGLECWLLERHAECVWYSVVYVPDD